MINYDKQKVKAQLSNDDIYNLLLEFNANPTPTTDGWICDTVCHNHPTDKPSHKLYYYNNDGQGLCHCYTGGCEEQSFDIFQLVQKIAKIQWDEDYDLNDSVRFVARRFGIAGEEEDGTETEVSQDWKLFAKYDRIKEVIEKDEKAEIVLETYNEDILDKFIYNALIRPWYDDGISYEVMQKARIGYFPGGSQITIPHFDINNNFIGLRGRALIKEEAEIYGKYRPIKINNVLYNHPLGFNLYGLNWNKENIKRFKKVIIFESEKSVLQYATKFGWENNISVACCGSNISAYQIQLLLDLGVEEIVVALDRDFEEYGDKVCKSQIKKYEKLNQKYGTICKMSFIFDRYNVLGLKQSPIERTKEIFLKLFKERVIL